MIWKLTVDQYIRAVAMQPNKQLREHIREVGYPIIQGDDMSLPIFMPSHLLSAEFREWMDCGGFR